MSETASLVDYQTLLNPYEAYKQLRDNAPVKFEPLLSAYVVTRYDLVREAIRDTQTYSSEYDGFLAKSQEIAFAGAPPAIQQRLIELNKAMVPIPPTMLTLDEPKHTQYRSLVSQLFTVSEVKKAEATVQAVVDRNVAKLASKTTADFVPEFAFPVPLRIIGDRLGIPEEDRAFFDVAATAAASALRLSPLSPEQLVERAETALKLQQLLVRLVEARRKDPQQDMITILATSKLDGLDRHLTHGEALSILNQFLVAGHETTSSTFAWGMLLLCRNPELQDQIRGNPKLVRTFIEEALRLESPVQGLPRLVTKDTTLGDTPLKAGDMIMLRYGAANRDERQFEQPDIVDVHREKAGMQLAFGAGVHFCIGAPLARQELNLGFLAILDRIKNIRLAPGYPAPEAEPSFILRNLPHLHITYELR
jgi:cytochrome P450